jgi:hypothetical protein
LVGSDGYLKQAFQNADLLCTVSVLHSKH